ncbi:decaprenyl-phosphate phosphoribosyltransferase [bacterium BMS3Bbin04]|nr:decaprenyl-phosphate phosphoribosyltransferase [bacterium BMS3Bbin04]
MLRPTQWTKNSLVLAPLIFSGAYGQWESLFAALIGFAGFSLTASGIYAFNDVMDAEYDRKHPEKKNRPVASGSLSPVVAILIAVLCLSLGLGASWWLNSEAAMIAVGYVALMLLYSIALKNILLLDVLIIAMGLTSRALYGAAAIEVEISQWLVICTFLISLMLALVKRRQELVRIGDQVDLGRRSLQAAPPVIAWDQWINSVAGITILAYILYTVDTRTVEHVGSNHLLYTTPFVIYGIFHYLGQVQRNQNGEDPTAALLKDRVMWITMIGWLIAVVSVLSGLI